MVSGSVSSADDGAAQSVRCCYCCCSSLFHLDHSRGTGDLRPLHTPRLPHSIASALPQSHTLTSAATETPVVPHQRSNNSLQPLAAVALHREVEPHQQRAADADDGVVERQQVNGSPGRNDVPQRHTRRGVHREQV